MFGSTAVNGVARKTNDNPLYPDKENKLKDQKHLLNEIAVGKLYLSTFLTDFKKEGFFQFDCILFKVCYLKAFEWVNQF